MRAAARLLGLPEAVLTKHPTAGLWGGQTDEDELGFTYHDADLRLVAIVDLGLTTRPRPSGPASTATSSDGCGRAPTSVAWKLIVPHTLSA